ncbi:MAG: phosphoadenosine phosphosulfate reductase [Sulfitobacter sp.]|nr:phosphoadenosine phosphosulfate reductase [Sulfitobacter sp.]
MADQTLTLESSLTGLSKRDWIRAVSEIVDEDGYFEQLGKSHLATFIEEGTTLLVTFETLQGIQALSEAAQPLGWEMVRAEGWSHLCLASDGDTWFRDPAVYAYFDRLVDDGFFDEFERVIFYGAGPCGYAAATYSVASPGATVIAIQPQATLDPRVTEWDPRFVDMRGRDFTTRYGYAPDMLDAADKAFVLYDPNEQLDAMHAALFTRPNVTKLRMRFMGNALQTDLLDMDQWQELLKQAADGTLDALSFARLYRRRRDFRPYLRNLLQKLERDERDGLSIMLCQNVTSRMRARMFAARLGRLQNRATGTGTGN